MKKLVVIFSLILVTTGAWAEWTGAAIWASIDTIPGSSTVAAAGDFEDGYFVTSQSMTMMSDAAVKAWGLVNIQIDSWQLKQSVDQFYKDQANLMCPTGTALKLCLEQLIAKTPDGVKLLNIVYQNVGGWKNIKSWPEYQASKNQ